MWLVTVLLEILFSLCGDPVLDQRLCRGLSGLARQSVSAWEVALQGRERVKAHVWSRGSE